MDIAKKEKKKEMKTTEKGRDISVTPVTRTFSPFEEMDRIFDNWFDNFSRRGLIRPMRSEWPSLNDFSASLDARTPNVDVIDYDDHIVIRAELPGISKNNLDVSISDDSVTIKEKTKREEKAEQGDFYRCEIPRGTYSRTIALSNYVNTEKSEAKFTDGVLELMLPKVEKAKRRTIKIE